MIIIESTIDMSFKYEMNNGRNTTEMETNNSKPNACVSRLSDSVQCLAEKE